MAGTRRKPIPPAPEDCDRLWAVRDAVPLTPEPETSCCARLMERADVPGQDDARTWLTFLRGLQLVRETDRGYVRTRDDPDESDLADRLLDGTYGAREVRSILETEGALAAEAVFEQFREHVPQYERHRSDDWERTWRERVERLLAWGVLLGLLERSGEDYRLARPVQGGSSRSDSESSR